MNVLYLFAGLAVLLSALYTKFEHGDPYFFGSEGVQNLNLRYLKKTTLSSGQTLCFVHELTYFLSILTPYRIKTNMTKKYQTYFIYPKFLSGSF